MLSVPIVESPDPSDDKIPANFKESRLRLIASMNEEVISKPSKRTSKSGKRGIPAKIEYNEDIRVIEPDLPSYNLSPTASDFLKEHEKVANSLLEWAADFFTEKSASKTIRLNLGQFKLTIKNVSVYVDTVAGTLTMLLPSEMNVGISIEQGSNVIVESVDILKEDNNEWNATFVGRLVENTNFPFQMLLFLLN